MEAYQSLLERRSVRAFTSEQVSREDLDKILEAGLYSSTGGGSQSTIFIAVQNPEVRAKLSAMNAAVMGKEGIDPYYGAPTVIEVLAQAGKNTPLEDGAIAIANLHNAAFALGLGGCWIHRTKEMFASQEGKDLLKEWGFDGEYIGIGAFILGHPAPDAVKPAAARNPGRTKVIS